MTEKRYAPIAVTPNFYQIGTPAYPAYISVGDDAMIIEGGIGATAALLADQIKELGIPPAKLKYLALTHTHPDHIGAVPYLKNKWPHLKVIAGSVAAKILKNEEFLKEFTRVDGIISEILLIKGAIDRWPIVIENPVFDVDVVVKEGDRIDLGAGVTWTAYETPGHAACHVSYYNDSGKILAIGDATGLYDPELYLFWPNYFDSLDGYCNSIRKLNSIPAKIGALSHNGIIDGDIKHYFQKAMKATEAAHNEVMRRLNAGEDYKKVALDIGRRVYTFTNMQPFETIHGLTRLMIKRSQAVAGKTDLFKLP